MTHPDSSLDRRIRHPAVLLIAFIWGLGEATFFFIVPDVWLSAIGCRSWKTGVKATGFAIIGALIGGTVMYSIAIHSPEQARSSIMRLPGIDSVMVAEVEAKISERGLVALLLGPASGIPYKIYAVEWGGRRGEILPFLLVSIPARGLRFLLTVAIARGASHLLSPCTRRRPGFELGILATFWIAFYCFYFLHFGW